MNKLIVRTFLLLLLFYICFGSPNSLLEYGYRVGYVYNRWPLYGASAPYCTKIDNVCHLSNKSVEFKFDRITTVRETAVFNVVGYLKMIDELKLEANDSCRQSITDYFCSQIPICDAEEKTFGEDTEKKRKACFQATKSCSQRVKRSWGPHSFGDCDHFKESKTTLRKCVPLPTNDICPKRAYNINSEVSNIYPAIMKKRSAHYEMLKPYLSSSCFNAYVSIDCYINGGPLCLGEDMHLVHALGKQDCESALKKCESNVPDAPNYAKNLIDICKDLPTGEKDYYLAPNIINIQSILKGENVPSGAASHNINKVLVTMVIYAVVSALADL